MRRLVAAALALLPAQAVSRVIAVTHDGAPVAGAALVCGAAREETGADGRARIDVPPGGCTLAVTARDLAPVTVALAPEAAPVEVVLVEPPGVEEDVVVTATRTGRLASNQVLRVEVVSRGEIEEKLLMTPGDIAMLLNETSGIRLQATSPALGAAAVRVQGLDGRYTPVLTDGLPINGTQVSSLGLLQVPPMDLRQVEVIKGAASALYGASALGGVINLVTRTAAREWEREWLLNATSRTGGDSVTWLGGPLGQSGGLTLLAGAHLQNDVDVDGDAWADLPEYRRVVVRPRGAWRRGNLGLEIAGGFTREKRRGGEVEAAGFIQGVTTTRADAGLSARTVWRGGVLSARGSSATTAHAHSYGADRYDDTHQAQFAEFAWARPAGGRHTVVVGAALDRQAYRNDALPVFAYAWTTPGVFVQDDWNVHPRWALSFSARLDAHPEFGALVSPRASSRVRLGDWDVRAAVGQGFFPPTALTTETDEVGLHRVTPPPPLEAERGRTASVDIGRRIAGLDLSVAVFAAAIDRALAVEAQGAVLALSNRVAPTRTRGAEIFVRWRREPYVVTAAQAWVSATDEEADGRRRAVPLTPRRSTNIVAAWERHGTARVGLEVYRTGSQRLDGNPYRLESPAYTVVGLLAERRFGRVRAFVNLENLTGVRQSSTDPLRLPVPAATGRRTVDAWAPLEGRTVNGGLRWSF
jgi:iron complex outermembrane receptor protein